MFLRNNKIRILYYEPSSGFGGSTNALAQVINNLDRTKFEPLVIIKNYGPQVNKIKNAEILRLKHYNEPEKKSNLLYVFCFFKNILPEAIKIYFIVKKKKISLVHSNISIMSGIPAIIAAKLARIPCISHFRLTRKLLKREILFAKWLDKLIVLNNGALQLIGNSVNVDKMKIIYDGIESSEFKNIKPGIFRKEFNFDSTSLIGLVGRIVDGKGQREFILCAKEVLKLKPQVKFLIIGEAKGGNEGYYKEIRHLVTKEKLEESIFFTGWRKDIKNIIADLDILIQATTTFPEGFGLTIIEAMALRKPVIATNIPGPSDIVVDCETGYLVPPGDINAMTEKIVYLLENPFEAKKMGEKGSKRAEEHFNIKNTIDRLEDLYIELFKCKN